jgi:hypothetical protein
VSDVLVIGVYETHSDAGQLVTRSQAKRLHQRVDRFRRVGLDFAGVELIGQGFADEVFRVFANSHPEVALSAIDAVPAVHAMIVRAGGRVLADPFDDEERQSTLEFPE